MKKLGKWILIVLGSIVILIAGAIGVGIFYEWYTYDRHAKAVAIIINTNAEECKGEDMFPIHIIIGNASKKVLEKTEFTLEARRKGRSSNIAEYYLYEDDHIIEPGNDGVQPWSLHRPDLGMHCRRLSQPGKDGPFTTCANLSGTPKRRAKWGTSRQGGTSRERLHSVVEEVSRDVTPCPLDILRIR